MDRLIFEQSQPMRLDRFVSISLPNLSRSYIAKLIDSGNISVNLQRAKPSLKLKTGDKIRIKKPTTKSSIKPVDIDIIYEDDFCLVINKPSGLITHSKGVVNEEATVASLIKPRLSSELDGNRAGIVHRLDRGTSGIIIVAKTKAALTYLQRQFSKHQTNKTYIALVKGKMERPEAMINMPIERNPKHPSTFREGVNGKPAETYYKVLHANSDYSLIELQPKTGRTHQLRVHLKAIGHPIVGDNLYGGEASKRLMLHAQKLSVILPDKGRVEFAANMPTVFNKFIN